MSSLLSPNLLPEVLATLLGALFAALYKRVLQPWFVGLFYERTELHKKYIGTIKWEEPGSHDIQLEIHKRGYDVTGNLVFLTGTHKGKTYNVNGRYSHGLLTFVYHPEDSKSTSQGSGTFQRIKDGLAFHGYFAYISQSHNSIEAVECSLSAV